MVHRLTGVAPLVDDEPIAAPLDAFGSRDLSRHPHEPTHDLLVCLRRRGRAGKMIVRDDEHMGRGLGRDVTEGRHTLGLMDDRRRDLSACNSAEETRCFRQSVTSLERSDEAIRGERTEAYGAGETEELPLV